METASVRLQDLREAVRKISRLLRDSEHLVDYCLVNLLMNSWAEFWESHLYSSISLIPMLVRQRR